MILKETLALLQKELQLEWRQKYALNGLLLYIGSTVFVVYLAFLQIKPTTWVTLLWIILLFTAVNAVAKSFLQERAERQLFYYTLASPQAIILSKMIYNILLLLLIAVLGISIYSLVLGNPVQNYSLFALTVFLGSTGFSLSFTLIAAITAKASNNATLMTVLSFPVIIPLLIMLIRLSKVAVLGVEDLNLNNYLITIIAINVMAFVLSLLLFPYLWRD